jgi:serine protease AprX
MPININGNFFDPDPAAATPQGAALDSADQTPLGGGHIRVDHSGDAANANYIVVTANEPLTRQQKATLAGLDVKMLEYIDNNSYLCEYRPSDLDRLRSQDFIKYAFVVPVAASIQSRLNSWVADFTDGGDTRTVDVVVHRDGQKAFDEVVNEVVRVSGVPRDNLQLSDHKIRLDVNRDQLAAIAALDHVKSVDQVVPVTVLNDVARVILGAENININGTAYNGHGQIVTVADTGLDKGSTTYVHPAFTGRVHSLWPVGRPTATNDFAGHGTHVAASVLGDADSNALGFNRRVQGTAPGARLIMQSLLTDAGGLFGSTTKTFFDLVNESYALDASARVHTNSWGIPWIDPNTGNIIGQIAYNNASADVDRAVWEKPDLVICFSAGNSGREVPDANTQGHVGGQAASKNCITVGASVSSRPLDFKAKIDTGTTPVAPLEDINKIATFSSRGPTAEFRTKPDVVSPGTFILSAKSRDKRPLNGADPVEVRIDKIQNSGDPAWYFLQGTSMATPLVAGCCAVLRQALIDGGTPQPTASLIKALLINGATDCGKSQALQGWGRANLESSIPLGAEGAKPQFHEGELLDRDDQDTFTTTVTIPANIKHLKATLVYNDPPGLVLQNDLNLTVTAADGTAKFGNMDNDTRTPLVPNNVEQVIWRNPAAGDMVLTVKVKGTMLTERQGFALVWRVTAA